MENKRVLLAVLAHPDDESFGTGGTLALYAQQGVEVDLVCATRGEAGTLDADCLDGFDSMAARREHELHCAAKILGLTEVVFLGYRDSGMAGSTDNEHPQALVQAPLEEAAAKIVTQIRRLKPQVVVTFDPIGGYKHPDHIHLHRATVKAFHLAGDASFSDPENLPPHQPQKLYYQTFSKTMLRIIVRLLRVIGRDPRRFGRNGDIDLLALVDDGNFPIHAVIDYRTVLEKRDAAAMCHASQLGGGPPRKGVIAWIWNYFGGREVYMRAYPEPKAGEREKDLFEGIS